jgi:hypothetical protein
MKPLALSGRKTGQATGPSVSPRGLIAETWKMAMMYFVFSLARALNA